MRSSLLCSVETDLLVKMSTKDVCRLCLANDKLVSVFEKPCEDKENLSDIVYQTTGVEISKNDIVSQKICEKCCQVTTKMLEFRKTSLKNDIFLKEECRKYLKNNDVKIPNTDVTIKRDDKNVKETPAAKEEVKSERCNNKSFKVHPSVRELFRRYPQIKLPTVCLKSHITPVVSLPMDGVENYFKKSNLDFELYTKLALKSIHKFATKKTSPKSKPTSHPSKYDIGPVKIKMNFNKNKENSPHSTSSTKQIACKSSSGLVTTKLTECKKRKLSEVENTPKEISKKPSFIESLGLTPKISNAESPAYITNMSVPLHICDICNSVQYSAKDLRKHKNKHLRCQFCKTRCRTLENKEEHLKNSCLIKNTMNNLPNVVIEKIEFNMKVRRKYSEAFANFSPLKDTNDDKDTFTCTNLEDTHFKRSKSSETQANAPEVIIEILSDDEDLELPANTSDTLAKNTSKTSIDVNQQTTHSSVPNPESPSSHPSDPVIEENIIYNTVSIVRPDIKIKENSILNNIDPKWSDMKVLKELLINYRPKQLYTEKYAQTEVPQNSSIKRTHQGESFSIEIKNLKNQMCVYKIPVTIKNGPFEVAFYYEREPVKPKKMCYWNDLTPIDVRVNCVNAVNSNSGKPSVTEKQNDKNSVNENNECVILPSTATYNSLGTLSLATESGTPTGCALNSTIDNSSTTGSSTLPIQTTASIVYNDILPLNPPSTATLDSLINNIIETQICSVPVTSSVPTSSVPTDLETTVENSINPIGSIRVKNVWELT